MTRIPDRARSHQNPVITACWALTCSTLVFVAYIQHAGRALSYDAAGTYGNFIATESLLDPFRKQVGYNNHVLFSFAEHLIYSAGAQSVAAMRVLPVTAAAATVGLVAAWSLRRFGWAGSAMAALVLAMNPEFAAQGRDPRGYALVMLLAVISTGLWLRALRQEQSTWCLWSYGAVVALAVGTHLLAGGIVVIHLAVAMACRKLGRRLLVTATVACAVGLLPLLPLLGIMRDYESPGGLRAFQASFPTEMAKTWLGLAPFTGNRVVPLLVSLPVVVGGWRLMALREGRVAAVVTGGILLLSWVIAPAVLAPRFFDWLLPAVALLAGYGASRIRGVVVLLPLLACASTLQFTGVNAWGVERYAWSEAARVAERQALLGEPVCVPESISRDTPFVGYSRDFRLVSTVAQLRSCDVVLRVVENGGLEREIDENFRLQRELPAFAPAQVLVRFR